MKELWLVCEGDKKSVDAAVLQPIFTRVLPAEIVVEPAGGSSVAAVTEFIQRPRGGQVAYVVDRDYRRREQAEESFRDGTNGFMWRRHSIENYLLPPAVILCGHFSVAVLVEPGDKAWSAGRCCRECHSSECREDTMPAKMITALNPSCFHIRMRK